MAKIIHITDPHLRADGQLVVGLDPADRLRRTVAAIVRDHADADACVVSGDLADLGEAEGYQLLQSILAPLPMPVHLLLGNHDKRAPFRAVFDGSPTTITGHVQFVAEHAGVALIGLDTLDESQPGQGLLCADRLVWLEDALARSRGVPTLVFMHHPPFDVGLPWFASMLVANGEAVMEKLLTASHVRHLALGHLHVTASGVRQGLSFSVSRGTCHKMHDAFSAQSCAYVLAPPAYDVLLATDAGVTVHTLEVIPDGSIYAREQATPDGAGIITFVGIGAAHAV